MGVSRSEKLSEPPLPPLGSSRARLNSTVAPRAHCYSHWGYLPRVLCQKTEAMDMRETYRAPALAAAVKVQTPSVKSSNHQPSAPKLRSSTGPCASVDGALADNLSADGDIWIHGIINIPHKHVRLDHHWLMFIPIASPYRTRHTFTFGAGAVLACLAVLSGPGVVLHVGVKLCHV